MYCVYIHVADAVQQMQEAFINEEQDLLVNEQKSGWYINLLLYIIYIIQGNNYYVSKILCIYILL